MVDKIITSSKLDTVFIQDKLKYSFALSLFFSLVSCDSTDIKFQNKAPGNNPRALIGEYQLKIMEPDTFHFDTISIQRINKNNYIIQNNKNDTLYCGEIRKKKNNYFLNKFDSTTGYWHINSFSIKKDSIHNF